MFGLIDCNNFYVSCERAFNPKINHKPVIVLSNNDGCVISRSDEAKTLGIKMGTPYFEISEIIHDHQVAVYSTNYTLYGSISNRVMTVLLSLVPDMEIYSIDEAFIDASVVEPMQLLAFGQHIKETIFQWTGIPVSIGFGKTKTLAKIANHFAKNHGEYQGVFCFLPDQSNMDILKEISLDKVWGIGTQYLRFFNKLGINDPFHLSLQDEHRVREKLGLMGQRIILETRGLACYPLNNNPPDKKEFTLSRSFGKHLIRYDDLENATSAYVGMLARRLRSQQYLAKNLIIFVMTNKYDEGPHYVNYHVIELPHPSDDTFTMVKYALKALKVLWKPGYKYKKSGVVVPEVVPKTTKQTSLWTEKEQDKKDQLSLLLDKLNHQYGDESIKLAIEGTEKEWKMRQNMLSSKYTTNWKEILHIDMDLFSKKTTD